MCYTYRHDYGLDRHPDDPPWVAGMTQSEREGLYRTMEQIYNNNVAPVIKHYEDLCSGISVVIPKDKEHAEALVRMGMFYLDQNKNDLS